MRAQQPPTMLWSAAAAGAIATALALASLLRLVRRALGSWISDDGAEVDASSRDVEMEPARDVTVTRDGGAALECGQEMDALHGASNDAPSRRGGGTGRRMARRHGKKFRVKLTTHVKHSRLATTE